MEPIQLPARLNTAIPIRFRSQRQRVLQILARWESGLPSRQLAFSAPSYSGIPQRPATGTR